MATQPVAVHLVVLVHGLWGSPEHLDALASAIRAASKARALESDVASPLVKILLPERNSHTATYDGIDYCAERVVEDIDAELAKVGDDGGKVTHISFLGYSLGGLIARYACGLLEGRQPPFFDAVTPLQFTTFASPWVGIPRYDGLWSALFWHGGSRLLSRTGEQLYLVDKFHPFPVSTGNQPGPSQPLVAVLAHPDTVFMRALRRFKKRVVYANAVQDRTVPFVTGAAEKLDPFADARLKAGKAMAKASWPSTIPPDLELGGVKCELDVKYSPLILSWKHCDMKAAGKPPDSLTLSQRLPIPAFLRPSSYPFKRPYNFLAVVFSPLLFPTFLTYVMIAFMWQGGKSRRRIRKLTVGPLATEEGRWARVSLGASAINKTILEGIEGMEESVGSDTADPVAIVAAVTNKANVEELPDSANETLKESLAKQSGLSPLQNQLIDWINQLPDLEKNFALFDHVRNAHGAIIYRAENLSDPGGKNIVQHFADNCLL